MGSKVLQAIRAIFAVAILGSWAAYYLHQHRANSALDDAPDPGPMTLGEATVTAPSGFVRVTPEMALALDETVTPEHYYTDELRAHPIVLVRRDRGSDAHPDLAVIELNA